MRTAVWTTITLSAFALLAAGCRVQGEVTTPPPPSATVTVGAGTPPPQQQVIVQPTQQPQPVYQQPQQHQPGVVRPSVQPTNTASNFGQISVQPGFSPDPMVADGVSGGAQPASARDARCRGHISGLPDHLLQVNGTFQHLRVMANSAQDVTLVILKPDGTYLCNDDSEGRNPLIAQRFTGGTHAIWVGSYSAGVRAPYRLGVSELRRVRPSTLGVPGHSVSVQQPVVQQGGSNFGTIAVRPGFRPDPTFSQGVSGGQVNANQIGSACRGWISQNPDHLFVAQGNFNPIRVLARSNEDTTLVIANQNGQVWCDDDGGNGRNPIVNANLPAGTYRVWIGSYRQGVNARYTIGFSELGSVGTMNLPAP